VVVRQVRAGGSVTREELITAARKASESDVAWYSPTGLSEDCNLPEADALFISLATPEAILELHKELQELQARIEEP
jgi:hypothetical protein